MVTIIIMHIVNAYQLVHLIHGAYHSVDYILHLDGLYGIQHPEWYASLCIPHVL